MVPARESLLVDRVMWQIERGGSPKEKADPKGKGSPDLDLISERERARV